MKPRQRRLEYERVYSGEFSTLEHARMTVAAGSADDALQIEFEALTNAFEKLLRQAVRLTSTGDKIEQQLVEVQRMLSQKVKQVEGLNRDLQRLNHEKTEFLELLSHDLRSPLSAVLTVLTLLRREREELTASKVDDLLEISMHSIENATNLIETILEASRVDSGNVNVHLGPCHLGSLMVVTMDQLRVLAERKNITLDTPEALPDLCALADPYAVGRILDNLLSNAVKYTPIGKRVWMRLLRLGDEIVCEVGDEGPGLSEEELSRLFRKYQRLSPQPTGKESSVGLGLAIAKGLAEQMNARLWCESVLGEGCRFYLALPVYKEKADPDEEKASA